MLGKAKKVMMVWLMLFYAGSVSTQYAINCAGGQYFSNQNNFQFSVGEAASLTLFSINNQFYATSGVLQPDPFLINFNTELNVDALGLFPNPAITIIQLSSKNSKLHFKILNAEAKILMAGIWVGKPIQIDHLPQGFYVIRLSDSENSTSKSIKFIKI